MNEHKIKNFAKQLVELSKSLTLGDSISAKSRSMSFAAGNQMIGLSDESFDQLKQLSSKFYEQSGWEDKYSESYIEELLRKVLGELFGTNQLAIAESALAKHFADYKAYQTGHSVLLPLNGLELRVQTFKIGRVNIVQLQKTDLIKRLGDHLMTFPAQQLLQTHSNRVLAEVEVIAEPIRAKEIAVEETRRALEVLRYGISHIFNNDYKWLRLNVSLVGDQPDSDCDVVIMPHIRTGAMTYTSDHNRPRMPLLLTAENITKLHDCGAMDIAGLLQKPIEKLTEMERVILRGLHWFGNALCQVEAENELLSLTTCLETFLTPRDGNPIGTAIAEGIAILLGNALEERKKLKKRVKDLYSKRSSVSHGGEKAVLDADLSELRDIAKRLIFKVLGLRTRLNSQRDLLDLIEDSKLG